MIVHDTLPSYIGSTDLCEGSIRYEKWFPFLVMHINILLERKRTRFWQTCTEFCLEEGM